MSGIKTGTPGFVNPVDGKVYTVDPVKSGDPSINPIAEAVDPGDMTVDNTVKDISKKTRITLGTYLSKVTKGEVGSTGVTNKYSVDASTENTQPSSLVDEKGYPLPISPSDNSEQFAKGLTPSTSENYSELQQGGSKFKKGLSSVDIPDGNSLLPNAAEKAKVDGVYVKNSPGLNEPIKTYTNIVVNANEFKPEEKFIESNIDPFSPPANFQPKINAVDPAEPKGSYSEINKIPVTLEQLRQKPAEITTANEYPVQSPGQSTLLSPITDPVSNRPVPLGGFANDPSYVKREQINPLSSDPSIQNFSKGKEVEAPYNGNNLLPNVQGNLNVVGVGARTKSGLPSGPDSLAIPTDNPLNNYNGQRGSSILGVGNNRWLANSQGFAPGVSGEVKLVLPDGTEVDQMKMAQIGTGLTQRAAAEIPAWTSSPINKFNPTGNEAELKALIPSVAQLGVLKVNNELLQAKDVFDALSDDVFNPDSLTSIAPFDGQSWGSLNTAAEPFDDPSSVGLSVTMLLMIISISALFTAIGETPTITLVKKDINGQLVKGKNTFTPIGLYFENLTNINEVIGIRKTNNPFDDALAYGTKAFFLGSGKAKTSLAELSAGAAGVAIDSLVGDNSMVGANLVVCRTIIRSGLVFAQQVEAVIKRNRTSGVSGAKGALALLKALRNSKLFSALNVFAQLGDSLLDRSKGLKIIGPDGKEQNIGAGFESVPNFVNKDTNITGPRPVVPLRQTVTKNRLSVGQEYDPTLSWSTARAPAMYLINPSIESIVDSEKQLGAFKGRKGLAAQTKAGNIHPILHKTGQNLTNRISNEDREKMESILDAEYVPFSFHDIRTNEVVSFHAFLASLSDDYSVSYESTDGFGRVEPIKTYKGTTRKIGISFYVAATSSEDFDHMWFKINKLTTLIYPQWTAGRDLLPGDYQFKAPFSQLPGATPLIRIRLGDLFRSNYSRFALARLFGAADGNMKLPDANNPDITRSVDFSESDSKAEERAKRRQEIINDFSRTKQANVGKTLNDDQLNFFKEKVDFNSAFVDQIMNIKEITKIVITGIANEEYYKADVTFRVFLSSPISENQSVTSTVQTPDGENYEDFQVYQDVPIAATSFGPLEKEINNILLKEGFDGGKAEAAAALDEFMNPAKNAIVKSFESAGGRGLAGVIESMNFDWYDRVPWDIDPGRTAPKLCKVTISFTPIHDIAPGIDHLGYNRAPIYPVGAAMYNPTVKKSTR